MRKINYIVVHCTATKTNASISSIKKGWTDKGWKKAGYHYLIRANGEMVTLLDEARISNGVRGYNSQSINVCYIGGTGENGKISDTRTSEQKASLVFILESLREKYPNAIIKGHRDFSPDLDGSGVIESDEWIKVCPCFDAIDEYKNI